MVDGGDCRSGDSQLLSDTRLASGIAPDQVYGPIFYILAGMLVVGFVANLLVRPVNPKWQMSDEELAAERAKLHEKTDVAVSGSFADRQRRAGCRGCAGVWLLVSVPLAWGVWKTVEKALVLFQ